jgi:hypothetical protein
VRHFVAGELLDGLGGDACLDRLLVVRVPGVLSVEVAGRDQQRQLAEPRAAGGAALGRDLVADLLLARGELGWRAAGAER